MSQCLWITPPEYGDGTLMARPLIDALKSVCVDTWIMVVVTSQRFWADFKSFIVPAHDFLKVLCLITYLLMFN